MKKFVLCLAVVMFVVATQGILFAKWKKDDSEKYLKWWDKQYAGTDSAVIGGVLYQKEDYNAAIAELEKAIQSGSTDGKVYYQLAYSYQQIGDKEKAIELYKKAVDLLGQQDKKHRYDYYAKYNLALLEKDLGKDDNAITILKSAIDVHPKEPGAHNLLGWLYWKKGDKAEALKEYSESIKIDPNQEDAQYDIGILYYSNGEVDEAKKAFEKVVQLNPKHEKAIFYIAHLGDKSLLSKEEYANLAIPDPALRHCYVAKQYLDEKKYKEAEAEYEAALEINPNIIEAHQGLGVAYEYNEKGVRYGDGFKIDKSIFHYAKALALNPKLESAVFNIGVLYSMEGRVDEAVAYYMRLIREDPKNAQAHYNLAVLYDNQGKDKEKAIYNYEKYLKLYTEAPNKSEVEERIRVLRIR